MKKILLLLIIGLIPLITFAQFRQAGYFNVESVAPLDSRLVVNQINDLTQYTPPVIPYEGMIVSVINDDENNGVYKLIDPEYTNLDNWIKLGEGDGIDDVNEENIIFGRWWSGDPSEDPIWTNITEQLGAGGIEDVEDSGRFFRTEGEWSLYESTVETKTDLGNIVNAYMGMVVSVLDDGDNSGVYWLIDNDHTNLDNWQPIGAEVGIEDVINGQWYFRTQDAWIQYEVTVETKADLANIVNPYIGMIVSVYADEGTGIYWLTDTDHEDLDNWRLVESGDIEPGGIDDIIEDNQIFGRWWSGDEEESPVWTNITEYLFSDAPDDGERYVRLDNQWVAISLPLARNIAPLEWVQIDPNVTSLILDVEDGHPYTGKLAFDLSPSIHDSIDIILEGPMSPWPEDTTAWIDVTFTGATKTLVWPEENFRWEGQPPSYTSDILRILLDWTKDEIVAYVAEGDRVPLPIGSTEWPDPYPVGQKLMSQEIGENYVWAPYTPIFVYADKNNIPQQPTGTESIITWETNNYIDITGEFQIGNVNSIFENFQSVSSGSTFNSIKYTGSVPKRVLVYASGYAFENVSRIDIYLNDIQYKTGGFRAGSGPPSTVSTVQHIFYIEPEDTITITFNWENTPLNGLPRLTYFQIVGF